MSPQVSRAILLLALVVLAIAYVASAGTVAKGDSCWTLAEKCGTDFGEFKNKNPMCNQGFIHPGDNYEC